MATVKSGLEFGLFQPFPLQQNSHEQCQFEVLLKCRRHLTFSRFNETQQNYQSGCRTLACLKKTRPQLSRVQCFPILSNFSFAFSISGSAVFSFACLKIKSDINFEPLIALKMAFLWVWFHIKLNWRPNLA